MDYPGMIFARIPGVHTASERAVPRIGPVCSGHVDPMPRYADGHGHNGGLMDETILSVGGLRLSAHLAVPPPPGRSQGLVVCHGFPNGPRGAATVGTTYADLADRLARDSGFVVLTFNFRGTGTSEGDFSVRGWLDDLRCAVRTVAGRGDVRGVWTVGFGHGATFALCEAVDDELVRGVAAIAARTSLGDWSRDPGGLVTEAREMGMIRTPGYPTEMGAWGRELPLLDAERAVRRLGDRPLLILHGVDDVDVPIEEARAVASNAGLNTEVRFVAGAGHHLRHDPRAIATLLGWLDRQA
jgi:putative redox protein